MSYVGNNASGYEHDIFVSYSHGPMVTEWSLDFADHLREELNYLLELKEPAQQIDLWMDYKLEGNLRLDSNLQKKE